MMKTLIQCDFDGTITEEDVSFQILDRFAGNGWRQKLEDYHNGRISVGSFNTMVFSMVKADQQTLVDFVRQEARLRPGFHELLTYCRHKGFTFIITSNGLDFYINTILKDVGVQDVKVFAARTYFHPDGLCVEYIGPDGTPLLSSFKEAYTRHFMEEGYHVIYVGNGISDIAPARLASYVFAREDLLSECLGKLTGCAPFTSLHDVVTGLQSLEMDGTHRIA